jgi:hypothetical protein
MDEQQRLRVISARDAVDGYRLAHSQLHASGWHRGIPEEHTPLLNKLLAELKQHGFSSLRQFWDASQELNILELGFNSREDFETKATPADTEALERMWH